MLLRISLIIAILAGIGTIVVTQLKTREHVQTIITARNTFETEKKAQIKRADKAETELASTKDKLKTTEGSLAKTEEQLNGANQQLASAQEALGKVNNKLKSSCPSSFTILFTNVPNPSISISTTSPSLSHCTL